MSFLPPKRLSLLASLLLLPAAGIAATPTHLEESVRTGIHALALVPGQAETEQEIAGSYRKATPGWAGGALQGAELGSPSTEIGRITVGLSIPQLILPGAIAGSVLGQAREKLQDFRDALARDLADSAHQPLTNSRLALQVYQELHGAGDPQVRLYSESVPVADETDAVLYVSIGSVAIDVRDEDAILKTTAEITLLNRADGSTLYQRWFYYQDQDSLSNWTRNDNALWRDYANFARHYLGREIAADLFTRVQLGDRLQPAQTDSVSLKRNDVWQANGKSRTPTLAWNLLPADENAGYGWSDRIDESNTSYELEIYDLQRPVYVRQGIEEPMHRVDDELEACKTYRWSVRPVYRVDGRIRYGEWMRAPAEDGDDASRANVGQKASELPAYIRYFPSLKINCRAK